MEHYTEIVLPKGYFQEIAKQYVNLVPHPSVLFKIPLTLDVEMSVQFYIRGSENNNEPPIYLGAYLGNIKIGPIDVFMKFYAGDCIPKKNIIIRKLEAECDWRISNACSTDTMRNFVDRTTYKEIADRVYEKYYGQAEGVYMRT